MTEMTVVEPQESEPPKRKLGRPKGYPKSGGRTKATPKLKDILSDAPGPDLSPKELRRWLADKSGYFTFLAAMCSGRPIQQRGPTGKALKEWYYPTLADMKWAASEIGRKCLPDLSATQLTGEGGGAIATVNTNIQAARVVEAFAEAADKDDADVVVSGPALDGIKAISFLQARAEAAERDQAPDRTPAPPVVDVLSPAASAESVDPTVEDVPPVGDPEAPGVGCILRLYGSDWFVRGLGADRPGLPNNFELMCPHGLIRRGPFPMLLGLLETQMGGDLGEWTVQEPRPQLASSRPDQHATRQPSRPAVNRRRAHTNSVLHFTPS